MNMKKVLKVFILCLTTLFLLAFTACGDDNGGTYYPNVNEMAANLEKNGYTTQFAVGERNSEGRGYIVDSLSATKGEDYIIFYWIEETSQCEIYYDKLMELHSDSPNFVLIENDEKFGNIVYCGTEDAVNAAGIKVVDVKVNVNVKV